MGATGSARHPHSAAISAPASQGLKGAARLVTLCVNGMGRVLPRRSLAVGRATRPSSATPHDGPRRDSKPQPMYHQRRTTYDVRAPPGGSHDYGDAMLVVRTRPAQGATGTGVGCLTVYRVSLVPHSISRV